MLESTAFEQLAFTTISAAAHSVERTPELIERGGDGFYKVSVLLAGTSVLVQDNRELVLRRGDISIYDTGRPYSIVSDGDVENYVVMVPKHLIDIPNRLVGELTAARLPGDSELGKLVIQHLLKAPRSYRAGQDRINASLAHTSVALIESLLTLTLGAEGIENDPHELLLMSIREYIEDRLGSPELTPQTIAAAHYISPRHLHGLFQEMGVTVSAYVRSRRLHQARLDVINPVLRERPIAAIAHRWGFQDAAHFSRTFKAEFGISPSALRP